MAETNRKKGAAAKLEKDALDRAKQYYNSLPGTSNAAKKSATGAASPSLKRSAASVATTEKPASSKRTKQATAKKSPTAAAKKERLTKRQKAGLAHAQRWAAQQGIAVKGAAPVPENGMEPPAASTVNIPVENPKEVTQMRQVSVEKRIKSEPEASHLAEATMQVTTVNKPAVGSPSRDPPVLQETVTLVDDNKEPDVVEEEENESQDQPQRSYFVPLVGIALLLMVTLVLAKQSGIIDTTDHWATHFVDEAMILSKKLIARGTKAWENRADIVLPPWVDQLVAEAEAQSKKMISYLTVVLNEIKSAKIEHLLTENTTADLIEDAVVAIEDAVVGTIPN